MLNEFTQRNFVVNNLQLLAAICWQGYLSQGRGVLLLFPVQPNTKRFEWLIPHSTTDLAGIYVGQQGQAFQSLFHGKWEKLSSVVANYSPEQVSLIAFHDREANQFSVFFVDEEVEANPIRSYESLRSRLVEFMST